MNEITLLDAAAIGFIAASIWFGTMVFLYIVIKQETKQDLKKWVRENYKRDL